ncbi:uncharacterized protein FTOL_11626 [Fusarium torulosum]|uniref:Uncharacterized protein n=1 Tax=Fusarium torulosum TaxID=33205 RepID=A0AAE8SN56_9HYPO|nr:uncharacterized protein FTOL_11626 [Fusarium torulosum]
MADLKRSNDYYVVGPISQGQETDKIGASSHKTRDQKGDIPEYSVTFSAENALGSHLTDKARNGKSVEMQGDLEECTAFHSLATKGAAHLPHINACLAS